MPKETLAILSPNQCAYLDATGSGCETVSHIYENGRVTIMFMSLDKSPRIVRLFCKGRVVEWDSSEFEGWVRRMGKEDRMVPGVRAVIVLDVLEVSRCFGRRSMVPCAVWSGSTLGRSVVALWSFCL